MDAQARKKALFRAKLKEQAQKTRIDSPLVRYNEFDQAVCRVCDVALKSESLWPAHQASKKHREAIINLKANASKQNSSSNVKPAPVKELAQSKPDGSTGFHDARRELSPELQKPKDSFVLPANFFDNPEPKTQKTGACTPKSGGSGYSAKAGALTQKVDVGMTMGDVKSRDTGISGSETTQTKGALPEGFFDKSRDTVQAKQSAGTGVSGSETTQTKGALPEGFFDNKEADLRARGIEPVKPDVKDEYKEFEKLIQEDLQEVDNRLEEEEIDAAEMIQEEEIVEQMTYKERVEMLKRKRKERVDSRPSKPNGDSNAASKKNKSDQDELSSEEDDDDESFAVDWRAQHL